MKIEQKIKNITFLFKGTLLKCYLILHGCRVGSNLKCKRFPVFRSIPKGNIFIGDNVNIGFRITFDINNKGSLTVGNRTNFTQDIIISSIDSIEIGSDVLIAEYVSIRDGDHQIQIGIKINQQSLSKKNIKIGNDVWIGAGTRILKGAILADGCVIGANSSVLAKTYTKENNVYAGSPIKMIRNRV